MEHSLYGKLKWQLILFLARRLPDCKSITPVLGESIDRPLALRERVITKLHLFTCEACRRYVEQVKFLHEAIRKHNEHLAEMADESTAQLSDEAKQRLKHALSSSTGLA